jgi:multidrug resistance efflux pump
MGNYEEITKLNELKKEGAISEEEFEQAKAVILSSTNSATSQNETNRKSSSGIRFLSFFFR